MDISGIISIAGKPGLYKVVSRNKTGLVVESLVDQKKMAVHASNKVSALEDISMYTYAEDIPLKDVFEKLLAHTNGKAAMDGKKASKAELFSYFSEVLEDFDEDRVYPSDVKKLFSWFNLLLSQGIIGQESATESDEKAEDIATDAQADDVADGDDKS